jgi:hypothetical protein
MSLVGNLEDLGLGEILQIVSLSRRSGVLSLESRGRQARIIFKNGQVIRATSTTFQQSLGEVLIRKGMIDLSLLRRALQLQADEGHRQLLGCLLIDRFGVSDETVEAVVREQIENVVYSLFLWAEGVFEFDLQEVSEFDATCLDPVEFMLKQGLNPQYLAMEGSRLLDELRRREAAGEAESGAEPSLEEAFDFDFDLAPAEPYVPEVPAVPEVPLVPEPEPEIGLVNLGDELRQELGEEKAAPTAPAAPRTPLKAMLEELNYQQLGGGIMLLVLRYAAEFLNRGVVLMVKKDTLTGLGQFGLEDDDGSADRRIRNLSIPRGEVSLFTPALENRLPFKGGLDDSIWSDLFLEQLGRTRPVELMVAPIVAEGQVVALLYGDNLPELKPVGDTEALEIFLAQVGIAMEKALLQRRLQEQGRNEK